MDSRFRGNDVGEGENDEGKCENDGVKSEISGEIWNDSAKIGKRVRRTQPTANN